MDSRELIQNFVESCVGIDKTQAKQLILNKEIWQYEEEFNNDVVHYTESDIAKIFVEKLHIYKPNTFNAIIDIYKKFYQYCVNKNYIERNPFKLSVDLNYEYLIRYAIDNGNVEFYEKEYIMERCSLEPYNVSYYKAIAFSLFEGVHDFKELVIDIKNVDFYHNIIRIKDRNFIFSDELKGYYQDVLAMKQFEGEKRPYGLEEGLLIRRIIGSRKGISYPKEDDRYYAQIAQTYSKRMQHIGLSQDVIYDSGVIHFFINRVGKEKMFDLLLSEKDKGDITISNKELAVLLKEHGIKSSPKKFRFCYKPYMIMLKYQE